MTASKTPEPAATAMPCNEVATSRAVEMCLGSSWGPKGRVNFWMIFFFLLSIRRAEKKGGHETDGIILHTVVVISHRTGCDPYLYSVAGCLSSAGCVRQDVLGRTWIS